MSDARIAMEQLRTALEEEGVVTDPAQLTDDAIARITELAYRAAAALEAARIRH